MKKDSLLFFWDNLFSGSPLDEATPHIHAYLVPLDSDGQLNCKALFGGREKMRKFQDDYHAAVQHLSLERGIKGSRAQHQDIKDFYQIVNVGRDLEKEVDPEVLRAKAADRSRAETKRKEMEQTASSLAQKVESLEAENSFLKTQVAQLRDLPLSDVAWHLGLDLDAKGKNRWKGHGHAINIDDYSFYDFSTERGGGGAIDLVMHVRGCQYKEAIAWLSSRFGEAEMLRAAIAHAQKEAQQISLLEPAPEFTPPTPDPSQWVHVKNYLTQKRKLPSYLIDLLHEGGLLYADGFQNAVFSMRSRDSVLTGAFLRGTKSRDFLGYAPDTKRDKGWFFFQLGSGDGNSIERIVITKSPIDAISYAALHNPEKRTLYLAADSARQLPPLDYLSDKEVIVAYDKVGDEKAKEIKQKVPHAKRHRPRGEDWNADLQELYLAQPPQSKSKSQLERD